MTQITDSDREAAADIWRDYVARVGEIIVEKQMRQGGLDDGLPTRLAEHRTQSTTAMSAEIEWLEVQNLKMMQLLDRWREWACGQKGPSPFQETRATLGQQEQRT